MKPFVSEITKTKAVLETLSTAITKSMGEINVVLDSVEHISAEYIHARKMESVGLMAGGIAHDFKNFIHIIAVNTNKIKGLTGDGRIVNRCDRILDICHRTSDLVGNIMTLVKTDQIQMEKMILNDEVEKGVSMLMSAVPDNVYIEMDLSGDLSPTLGNPAQVCQVVTNLVNNAIDAIDGKGRINIVTEMAVISNKECQAHANARPGRFVSLTVSDSGSGMPRDLISRIFDPFFSTKQGRDNAGFGLAMVYAILENHHGWIDVESKVGKGTRFTMFFPAFHEKNKAFNFIKDSPVRDEGNPEGGSSGVNEFQFKPDHTVIAGSPSATSRGENPR